MTTQSKPTVESIAHVYGATETEVHLLAKAIRDYAEQVRRETIEEASALCVTHADAYRELQIRARNDNDMAGAVAHLCEKEVALMLSRDIRKLLEKK